MTNILTIFGYEFNRNIRRKGFLFMTFGIPLIAFVLMIGYNVIQSNQPADDDASQVNSILTQFDFEGITKAGLVDTTNVFPGVSEPLEGILIPYPDDASAAAALRAGEVDVYYTISPDYLQTGEVTLHLPNLALDKLNSTPIEQLFYTTLASDIDPTLLNRLRLPIQITEFNLAVTADEAQDEDANFLILYIFVITFLLGLFLTNGYLLQSVIEEKENKVVEVLITSVKATELLAGKVLAFTLMGLIQIVSWIAFIVILISIATRLPAFQTVSAIMNLRVPVEDLPLMFAYFVLGYLFFAGVFGAVGAISNSMREGPGYAAIFTLPAAFPFYFFTLFQATPNAPLPTFLSIFPLTSPISMMMRLSTTQVPTGELILSLGLLAVTAFGMIWVAGRIFRVQSLLSGKVPKLRELPTLLRG
jgi:ABC-2 type transport system permease protein